MTSARVMHSCRLTELLQQGSHWRLCMSPLRTALPCPSQCTDIVSSVQAKIKPVSAVVGGISSGANYAKGLWDRLNGGGRRMTAGNAGLDLPYKLPVPIDTRGKRTSAIAQLSRDIDALEQKLQEASKVCHIQSGCHVCTEHVWVTILGYHGRELKSADLCAC